jgi:predicted acetyltransferase
LSVEIIEITEKDRIVLQNLMSLYLHDMSEFADFLNLCSDGTFKYQDLHLYWEKEELSAFLIVVDSLVAGFILSNKPPYIPDDCDISIQEFFILKKYRGRGIGFLAASRFFEKFPGRYLIAQLISNKPAIGFWQSVYKKLDIEIDQREETESGVKILTQRFTV